MIWFLVVLGLAIAWVLLRQRTPPKPQPKSLPDPRVLLARELQQTAATARDEGRFSEAQAAELRAAWLLSEPPLGQDAPPKDFDVGIQAHLQLADIIRRRYAAVLSRDDEYANCAYKPAAFLPFPKAAIERAMDILIGVGEGSIFTPHVAGTPFSDAELTTMKASVKLLNNYLDVPPDVLPHSPPENEAFGRDFIDRGQA